MTPAISPNTQAILMLTAPLIAGKSAPSPDLLKPSEYKGLARHLREIQRQPADLLYPDAAGLLGECHGVIDESRLRRLLARGFLLSQAVERWQARAIWIVSRADSDYPRRFKARLREDAPAVLYGCGDISLLDSGGIAVVGSRQVDDSLLEYTTGVGRLAARSGRTLVSGGAKGIDQAAMRGALDAGGKVSGVLADSLERAALNREQRNFLLDDQLVLISPYDPSAGFNVGNAMQRNKLVYALADASLVVNCDLKSGGTWSGAIEQVKKFKFVPVYVRSTGEPSEGLDALVKEGALPWPNPQDVESFEAVFKVTMPTQDTSPQGSLLLFEHSGPPDTTPMRYDAAPTTPAGNAPLVAPADLTDTQPATEMPDELLSASPERVVSITQAQEAQETESSPAELLFSVVRNTIVQLLKKPMNDVEVAAALDVSKAQAKAWLQRLLVEGVLEKQKKPAGYIARNAAAR